MSTYKVTAVYVTDDPNWRINIVLSSAELEGVVNVQGPDGNWGIVPVAGEFDYSAAPFNSDSGADYNETHDIIQWSW